MRRMVGWRGCRGVIKMVKRLGTIDGKTGKRMVWVFFFKRKTAYEF